MFTLASLLFAFGFGSLSMLGWAAAAAAPLLIHLWNKRKYREVSWAAVEFLLAAMRRNARRIQLMQWLLLAVRTALILLVVAAMAEPFLERAGLGFIAGQRTHKVLVLDGSYSMGYRPTDSSRFARAQQLARQIVEESSQGDGFTLILMSDPARTIVGTPAFAARDFIEEVDALKLPHTGGDLTGALTQVKDVLARAREEYPDLDRSEAFFLTDLGRNSWVPEGNAAAAPAASTAGGAGVPARSALDFRKQVEELAQAATLVVLDLGQAGSENVAVTGLTSVEPFATLWREASFQMQVKNFGSQPRSRHVVELLVDDARVKEEHVDLEPGGDATINFTHRFETPGFHVVRARSGSDLLDVDNSRWLSIDVKQQLQTLVVGGKEGETRYLVDALDPTRSDRALTHPRVVPESALLELDLDEFDCIFLCNVAQFTANEARLLEAYLKRGGGLVFFLGDRVLAERYNRELAGDRKDSLQVLPARLGDVVAEAQYRFDPLEYRHPLVKAFRGRERAGLLTTPIYRYFRLKIPDDWTQSRVALAFEGGDPAIVEAPLHRGRSIVVATAASLSSVDSATNTPWTTMPAWPSFVPIVQELLAMAVGSQMDQYNARVGESIGTELSGSSSATAIAIRPPGDDSPGDGSKERPSVPAGLRTGVDETRWSFDKTDQFGSGVYLAEIGAGGTQRIPFAVNVDAAGGGDHSESNLRKAEPDELPSQLLVQTDWQNLDEHPTGDISRRAGLQRWLLYGALGLVFVEMILAWRFGKGGT